MNYSPPRMSDVAARAGVATSTVSRALKRPDLVDPVTRQRILQVIADIGYVPNATAGNLRGGTSKMVLIVLPETLSPLVLELLQAIDTTLAVAGYLLIIGNLGRYSQADNHLIDLAHGGLAAGILLVSGEAPRVDGRSVLESGLPTVALMVDLSGFGIPSIVTNDRSAIEQLTNRMIDDGHRRFFYIEGPRDSYHEVERSAGVEQAVRGAGIDRSAILRYRGDFSLESGFAAARAYLDLPDRPTAVICCNDEMALGFMTAVERAGLTIPSDVSVSGFDGIKFATFREPALTTIRQPLAEIGAAGAESLMVVPESTLAEKSKGLRTAQLDPSLCRRFGLMASPARMRSRAANLLIELARR